VRLRPLSDREQAKGASECVEIADDRCEPLEKHRASALTYGYTYILCPSSRGKPREVLLKPKGRHVFCLGAGCAERSLGRVPLDCSRMSRCDWTKGVFPRLPWLPSAIKCWC
jgi:hypothetical protein